MRENGLAGDAMDAFAFCGEIQVTGMTLRNDICLWLKNDLSSLRRYSGSLHFPEAATEEDDRLDCL